jgi:hypothetical protein
MSGHGSFKAGLFYRLLFAFLCLTMAGTLWHELGHFIAAKYYGFHPQLSFNHTHWEYDKQFYGKTTSQSYSSFNESEAIKNQEQSSFISLGGPIMTMGLGTIGFIGVLVSKHNKKQPALTGMGWLFVFFSLFWMRQLFNACRHFLALAISEEMTPSDEEQIAVALKLAPYSISLLTALAGLSILGKLIFSLIPLQSRYTFVMAGIIGGPAGYLLWMHFLGPLLLP